MIVASLSEGGWSDLGTTASPDIRNLQAALKRFADATGNRRLDPLEYDGVVRGGTVAAAYNAIDFVAKQVPLARNIRNILQGIPFVSAIIGRLTDPPLARLVWDLVPGSYQTQIADAIWNVAARMSDTLAQLAAPTAPPGAMVVVHPALVTPLPAKPPVAAFPVGTVARWHVGERTWWVYAPGKAFEGGFGDALGDAPAPDAKVAGTEASVPAGATRGPDIGRPWYRDWRYLLPIGAGVVAVGAGGYLLMRRKAA